jgi:amino acid transporter
LICFAFTAGVVWSWIIAGFGCSFSALSYAEMASRVPSAGSSYAYVYTTLGELPAVLAAWCLTLEYGLSGAAVARSWGEKVVDWAGSVGLEIWAPLDPGVGINIFAALLQASMVVLLLGGVNIGKNVVNFFTVVKMVLVLFMIVAGLSLFRPSNVTNWAPMGFSGILRGSTSAFFGYLGYDEVCCLAAEAKNPQETLPKAVFGTIGTVTVLYSLGALALAGMMPYQDIDSNSGFSEAFKDRDWHWAQQIVAVGEICTLPLVVLISFIAQPRLQFAMAQDGLLPRVFAEVDSSGNLRNGILISGVILTAVALFVPFTFLDDMISAGVLLSFNLTNTALIVTHRSADIVPLAAQVSMQKQ